MSIATTDLAQLRGVAEAACRNAAAPYSNFTVGAALRTVGGNIYPGCNVETANYGLTICAERAAIVGAVAAEGPQMRIESIVIVTGRGITAAPCGSCRQVIYEFGPECEITLVGTAAVEHFEIRELLPHPFGPADLKRGA